MEKVLSNKNILLVIVLIVIAVTSLVTVLVNRKEPKYQPGESAEFDKAVNQAQVVYKIKQSQGIDFTDGPCLTNDLLPDWVADVVHDPRTEVDEMTEHQCQAFLEGRAKHFVELDINGEVVRVQ